MTLEYDSDTLKDYTTTEPLVSDDTTTGTCVVFNKRFLLIFPVCL